MGWASDPTLSPWWMVDGWTETKFVFEGNGLGFHLWGAKKKLECVYFGMVFVGTGVNLELLIDLGMLDDNFGFLDFD